MFGRTVTIPDAMPVLAAGKHRNPRKGGCFMEFASYLAGEPWSDHPKCTHPLLAALARDVNDCVSDSARQRLVPMIPSVIGLTGDDPMLAVGVAVRAGTAAIGVAPWDRQRAVAVGLLRCHQELAKRSGPLATSLRDQVGAALEEAPTATRWALGFVDRQWGRTQVFTRTAPHIVHLSVHSIAMSSRADVDDRLCSLLESTIDEFSQQIRGSAAEPVDPDRFRWSPERSA